MTRTAAFVAALVAYALAVVAGANTPLDGLDILAVLCAAAALGLWVLADTDDVDELERDEVP